MKHIHPISKATDTTGTSNTVSILISVLQAVVPIVSAVVNAKKGTPTS